MNSLKKVSGKTPQRQVVSFLAARQRKEMTGTSSRLQCHHRASHTGMMANKKH